MLWVVVNSGRPIPNSQEGEAENSKYDNTGTGPGDSLGLL